MRYNRPPDSVASHQPNAAGPLSSYETKRTTYQQQLSVLDTANCWLERMGRAIYDSRLLLGPTA